VQLERKEARETAIKFGMREQGILSCTDERVWTDPCGGGTHVAARMCAVNGGGVKRGRKIGNSI